MALENSEVSPKRSEAVVVMTEPAVGAEKMRWKVALPLGSVVTLTTPAKVWPWPKPLGSAVGLVKNSMR